MTVSRLLRVSLTVSDLERVEAFYRDTLDFVRVGDGMADDPGWMRVMGVEDAAVRSVIMRLGAQEIELVAFDPPGRPYPAGSTAHDPWFQHLAIVVRDMEAAWARVQQAGVTLISTGSPQKLPPNTGSVTACKFRDPDGHPLELIAFPAGVGDPVWQHSAGGLFLGYDHSAIVVRDAARSRTFYTRLLGFQEMAHSLNRGTEQERLDGTPGDIVDVVALAPGAEATPRVELLGYRVPPVSPALVDVSVRDVASARLVLEAENVPALAMSLTADTSFLVHGVVRLNDGRDAMQIRDPDGHRLLLIEAPRS